MIEVGKKYIFPKYCGPIYEILAIHDGMAWCLIVSKDGAQSYQNWKVSQFEDCIEYKEPPKPVEFRRWFYVINKNHDLSNTDGLEIDYIGYTFRETALANGKVKWEKRCIGVVELKGEFVPK